MDPSHRLGRVPTILSGTAVRDAEGILRRADLDERDALEARRRYRTEGLPRLAPAPDITGHLQPGEAVIDVRAAASVDRHIPGADVGCHVGRLFLTTARLLVVGPTPLSIALAEIEELTVAGERLLVSLVDGWRYGFMPPYRQVSVPPRSPTPADRTSPRQAWRPGPKPDRRTHPAQPDRSSW
jgi:rhodanese-related sulfurtransferase